MTDAAAATGFEPLRLPPGADLRGALEQAARERGMAAFVVCGIGSLGDARLRLAGDSAATVVAGPSEIVSLAGSLTPEQLNMLQPATVPAPAETLPAPADGGAEAPATSDSLVD